jgi:hypothetical protein
LIKLLLLIQEPAAEIRLLQFASDVLDQSHRGLDRGQRIVVSGQGALAAREAPVERDEGSDTIDPAAGNDGLLK